MSVWVLSEEMQLQRPRKPQQRFLDLVTIALRLAATGNGWAKIDSATILTSSSALSLSSSSSSSSSSTSAAAAATTAE
ncbi:hypothetical protein EV1_006616 [Malus domestica]